MQPAHRRLAALVAALALSGCAAIEDIVAKSYTEPWCYPKIRADFERERYYAGISCRF